MGGITTVEKILGAWGGGASASLPTRAGSLIASFLSDAAIRREYQAYITETRTGQAIRGRIMSIAGNRDARFGRRDTSSSAYEIFDRSTGRVVATGRRSLLSAILRPVAVIAVGAVTWVAPIVFGGQLGFSIARMAGLTVTQKALIGLGTYATYRASSPGGLLSKVTGGMLAGMTWGTLRTIKETPEAIWRAFMRGTRTMHGNIVGAKVGI